VTSQNSSPVKEHLQRQGFRFGSNFILEFRQKPYINAGIVLDWIRAVFLRPIDTRRGLVIFASEVAVLLMNNCSARVSHNVIRILTEARVGVIPFAPHATQVFHVLDLSLRSIHMICM
jgi:hypothetical protein